MLMSLSELARRGVSTPVKNEFQDVAVIDIGSNSCRLLILTPEPNGHFRIKHEEKAVLKLIRSVDQDGRLSGEAELDLRRVLADFGNVIRSNDVERIDAVGTAALRAVSEPNELLTSVGGVVRIIDGLTEAHLGFAAAVESLPIDEGLFIDIGGGSTEVVRFKNRKLTCSDSLNLGGLRTSDRFFDSYPPAKKSLQNSSSWIQNNLDKSEAFSGHTSRVVGVGGTVRNIAKIHRSKTGFKFSRLHGYEMSIDDVRGVFDLLRLKSEQELLELRGLNSNRIDSIIGGTQILVEMMDRVNAACLMVSGRGIRDSLATYGATTPPDQISSIEESRKRAIDAVCRRFASWNPDRASRRASILERLLRLFDPEIPARFHGHALHAATMADVGSSLDYYNRWNHSAGVAETSELSGFDHRDITIISGSLRAADKHLRHLARFGEIISSEERNQIRHIGIAIALADGIERRLGENWVELEHQRTDDNLSLSHPNLGAWDVTQVQNALEALSGIQLSVGGR